MHITYKLDQLTAVAAEVLKTVQSKTILFYGEMGVGKTTLIKEICQQLGVTDHISSPTFSIVNEYQSNDIPVFHFDCYRIESESELDEIGFEEYLNQNAWVLIEWPENIPTNIPKHADALYFKIIDFETRSCELLKKP